MKLYSYWRSSAAYRVRIGLNLKGLEAETVSVHLVKNGGEQKSESYLKINPHGLVPALETDGHVISNSLAILEYLEEVYPQVPILPSDALARARVRQIALAVAADIHPVQNLRVLQRVSEGTDDPAAAMASWARHWIEVGFDAIERQLSSEAETGRFAHGDTPTLADICLIPQIVNARRYDVDMTRFPTISRINEAALLLPAFDLAAPQNQPDAET
ncbi:MAG: maleylacetoacetate isomerase [Alphaproteobacteria bacterium]|nr:MAG: maleylacetoacetate isomerase [Alphaproteobacteria bacterium]